MIRRQRVCGPCSGPLGGFPCHEIPLFSLYFRSSLGLPTLSVEKDGPSRTFTSLHTGSFGRPQKSQDVIGVKGVSLGIGSSLFPVNGGREPIRQGQGTPLTQKPYYEHPNRADTHTLLKSLPSLQYVNLETQN